MNLNIKAQKQTTYDAIVVGSGISGGWAAKELTEKGLKVVAVSDISEAFYNPDGINIPELILYYNLNNKSMLYRLGALGLKKGSLVSIKRKCLFNGPSVIEINGQYLSIRQSDARQIALEE